MVPGCDSGHRRSGRLDHPRALVAEHRRVGHGREVPVATVQVTASFVVTPLLTPMLTAWMYRRVHGRAAEAGAESQALAVPKPATEPV